MPMALLQLIVAIVAQQLMATLQAQAMCLVADWEGYLHTLKTVKV